MLWSFFKLNIIKALIFPIFRSAKDADRLRFELHLCGVAQDVDKRVLFVGVHERSFVYQLVFPFYFCDIDNSFLINTSKVRNGPCQNLDEDFDLVILAGVFNYGTNSEEFLKIIQCGGFKRFLILDWKKNMAFHQSISGKGTHFHELGNVFYYYYER